MEAVRFEIDGHQYMVMPHKTREAHRIARFLAATGFSVVVRSMLPALQRVAEGGGDGVGSLLEMDLRTVLQGIDTAEISDKMAAAIENMDDRLLTSLFRHTVRDEKPLGDENNYDAAYAQNWGEWYLALWQIVKANGFVPFLSTRSGAAS